MPSCGYNLYITVYYVFLRRISSQDGAFYLHARRNVALFRHPDRFGRSFFWRRIVFRESRVILAVGPREHAGGICGVC